MQKVELQTLNQWMLNALSKCGVTDENSQVISDVVMRATLRGVGHHDIYDFPSRIAGLLNGSMVPNPKYVQISKFASMESWDAGNGLGELVCSFAMDRAMALADEHGMGLCAIRNSNHFLASAPYIERATEKGYIALLLSKGAPTMGAPGRTDQAIGALPMGFAIPTDRDYPIMLDFCMAYASFGLLKEKMDKGQSVPAHWGYDAEGKPTEDPVEMAKGTRLPIGGHKGFGMAILGEVLTALLSEGCIVDEPDTLNGQKAPTSHTAIAIKADALMDIERFRARSGEMIDRMEKRAPGLHVPGQGSYVSKQKMQREGAIELKEALVERLNSLSAQLGIEGL